MTADYQELFNPKVAEAVRALTATGGYPKLLGIQVADIEPGRIVCTLQVEPHHTSAIGLVHGGVLSSLADHALSLVVYPLVDPGKWVATLELKLNYTGPVREGELRATGQVVSLRKRVAVARVDIENDGRPVAAAQGTLYIKDAPA